jgi:hypothetical protein
MRRKTYKNKNITYLAPKLKAGARPRLDSGTKFPVKK